MTKPASETNVLLAAALAYAAVGWYVVACHHITRGGKCSCGGFDKKTGKPCKPGKHPRWHRKLLLHGLNSATTDPELIKKWWDEWPKANVAINCGLSKLVVVDVDPKDNGLATWAALVAANGAHLEETYTVITQSGGRHYYFTADDAASIASGTAVLGPGVDIKADGGYVVAPPSKGENGIYRSATAS